MHSLSALAARRTPHHRKYLIWCIVGMPFTAPFALIPVVPNLPFFYLVWRAYSHWSGESRDAAVLVVAVAQAARLASAVVR